MKLKLSQDSTYWVSIQELHNHLEQEFQDLHAAYHQLHTKRPPQRRVSGSFHQPHADARLQQSEALANLYRNGSETMILRQLCQFTTTHPDTTLSIHEIADLLIQKQINEATATYEQLKRKITQLKQQIRNAFDEDEDRPQTESPHKNAMDLMNGYEKELEIHLGLIKTLTHGAHRNFMAFIDRLLSKNQDMDSQVKMKH
jgi:hypothetical protein